jgi:hypothetical protein
MANLPGSGAWAEARLALTGTLRLARGDPGGLACFDASEEGFWRSFHAAAICYPLYLFLLSFPIEIGPPVASNPFRYALVETIRYVIAWVAFPLIALPLVDWLGRSNRYFGFMVAYNWCQVPQTAAFFAVTFLGAIGLLPAEGVLLGDLVVGIGAIVYEWYVSRAALAISGPRAGLVILIDLVLATFLSHISAMLY